MKKTFYTKALVACAAFTLATAGLLSCKLQDADAFTAQPDMGIVVSSIELSANSVSLSGSRALTATTLTATVSPSYALDTTISWVSADESVATVEVDADDTSSVSIVLQGSGTTTITAASGTATATCTVICEMETTPPLTVSDVAYVANGNNVFFTWTDPVDYDEDLDHILITAYTGKSSVASAEIPAGVQYGWITGLSTGSTYSFTFNSYDVSGNASSAVTVDEVTTGESENSTAPDAPADFAVAENGGETISFSWTASSSGVYQKLTVTATDGGTLPTVLFCTDYDTLLISDSSDSAVSCLIPNNTVTALSATGFATGSTYTVTLAALTEDFAASESVSLDVTAAPAVSGVAVSLKYTGSIIVTWTDFANSEYTYTVSATDGSATVTSDSIAYGTQSAHVTGLTVGTDYTVTVSTYDADGTHLATSAGVTCTPKTMLWQVVNAYNASYLMAPYITSSVTYSNICTVSATSSWSYPYWIVHPSLSTPEDSDTFSLESSTADGTATGLYLCIDNVQAYNSSGDASGWGYPYSSHSYHAYSLDADTIERDMGSLDYASFSLLTSSVSAPSNGTLGDDYSSWYVWQVGSTGYYLYDTYLNVSGESSYSASSVDNAYAYCQTVLE